MKFKIEVEYKIKYSIYGADAKPKHIDIVNNFENIIFKQMSIYSNRKIVESKMHYGVMLYIKTLKETDLASLYVCGQAGTGLWDD